MRYSNQQQVAPSVPKTSSRSNKKTAENFQEIICLDTEDKEDENGEESYPSDNDSTFQDFTGSQKVNFI